MFAELLAHPGVEEVVELRGPFGFMAYHGGSLEEATDVIARAAAEASGASYYGVHQPADLQWHIPSTLIDPAESSALAAFLDHVDEVITVHGYGRDGWWARLLVGGGNRPLAEHLGDHLRRRGRHRPRGHPTRAPGPPPSQPGQRRPPGWRATGATAAGAGHQPALLGLGGPGPQPAHAGRGRRPRGHRGHLAGLSRSAVGRAPRSALRGRGAR